MQSVLFRFGFKHQAQRESEGRLHVSQGERERGCVVKKVTDQQQTVACVEKYDLWFLRV
jgi:hypothetical protein